VELEGIEPSSAKRSPTLLRPFPCPSLYGWLVAGSTGLAPTASSLRDVSGLSHRQRSFPPSTTASVAGLQWSGPVRHCWSRCLSWLELAQMARSGGESEVAIGASVGAPFFESEQLGSHDRLPVSTSKPVSPLSKRPRRTTAERPGHRSGRRPPFGRVITGGPGRRRRPGDGRAGSPPTPPRPGTPRRRPRRPGR